MHTFSGLAEAFWCCFWGCHAGDTRLAVAAAGAGLADAMVSAPGFTAIN
jgi:hypothetical protein